MDANLPFQQSSGSSIPLGASATSFSDGKKKQKWPGEDEDDKTGDAASAKKQDNNKNAAVSMWQKKQQIWHNL